MTNRLRIDRLDWDEWNREHAIKHDVTFDEIAAALKDILFVKPSYKDRVVIFGRGPTGRILAVVVGEVPNKPNVYYVFSARHANRRERRDLQQEHGT